MKLENELFQRQQLILTPKMELSLHCLQLPLAELEEYVMNEAQENPIIDLESLNHTPVMDEELFDRISPSHEGFKEHLIRLLELLDLPEGMKELCTEIVYRLDPRGLLPTPLPNLAAELQVPLQILSTARDLLREIAPLGTAAESEEECFELRGEKSYPASGFGGEDGTGYVKPDIVIAEHGGSLKVEIRRVDIGLSRYYLDLMKSGDPSSRKFLRAMKKRADLLIYALERREEMLKTIARILVELNGDYFLRNTDKVRRISVSELARRVRRNKSTASRAVNGKYVLSPKGLHPLNFFFGNTGLRAEVIFKISQMLQDDPTLTDVEMTRRLRNLGFDISRRTVNKYRHMLVRKS